MKSKVFFIKTVADLPNQLAHADLAQCFAPADFIACKIHFGEKGNRAYLKAQNVKPVVAAVQKISPHVFLTDCNTIYKGSRSDAVSHITTAKDHGYDFAPVIIADGLHGHNTIEVPVNLKYFTSVKIGSAVIEADALLCLTHFKGHDVCGFGGAIKNLGMGCGTRAGKQLMHAEIKPQVKGEKCTGCGKCIQWCPADAISFETQNQPLANSAHQTAFINQSKCIGCAECIAACNFGAIRISWEGSPHSVQEKMAEYAVGVLKNKSGKAVFFNYLLEISPNCDCYGENGEPIVPDIGILFSTDPVAIDQASLDLVNRASGKNIFGEIYPDLDCNVQLAYAEQVGLGQREYEIITV